MRLDTETTNGKGRDALEKKIVNVVATREAQFEATQSSLFVEESLREPNVGQRLWPDLTMNDKGARSVLQHSDENVGFGSRTAATSSGLWWVPSELPMGASTIWTPTRLELKVWAEGTECCQMFGHWDGRGECICGLWRGHWWEDETFVALGGGQCVRPSTFSDNPCKKP